MLQGSCDKISGHPKRLTDLYGEICQGRKFAKESDKIRNIQLPSIRYFAHFVSKCVLARKSASKLSLYDLAFLSAALRQDKTYNLGALIAFRLATNREKGGICGGLIASRLLALHDLLPHPLDVQFPIERLDVNSMIRHGFVTSGLTYTTCPMNYPFSMTQGGGLLSLNDQSFCLHLFCLTLMAGKDGH